MRYRLDPMHVRETDGDVLSGATVTVYLAGGLTLATCYADRTTGTSLSGSQTTTDSSGFFLFYVDSADYVNTQKFKIIISKTGYASITYDEIDLMPDLSGLRDPYVDVRAYGAVGDGATNDTTAIANAVSAALSNKMKVTFEPNSLYSADSPVANVLGRLFFSGMGALTIAKSAGGSLSAETYTVIVMSVDSQGGESVKSPSANITISAGDVSAGTRQIDVSWDAVIGAASYRVYMWNSAQGGIYSGRYYTTSTNSITITTDSVGPPINLAAVATTGGSLASGAYNFWVTATFSDGETPYSNSEANPHPITATILSINHGNGQIDLTWDAVTGASGYRVYIGSETLGGPRPALFFVASATNSLSYTGQTLTFHHPFGNTDLSSSNLGIFGSIRTIANAKSMFAGDILINGDNGSEAVYQANRTNADTSLCGQDYRTDGAVIWRHGMANATDDLQWYLSSPPANQNSLCAYFKQSSGDFYVFRSNDGTADEVYPLVLKRSSTGTVADNFGTGIKFELESAGGTAYTAGNVVGVWDDATNKRGAVVLYGRNTSGTLNPAVYGGGDGLVGISTVSPTFTSGSSGLDINGNTLKLRTTRTPASAVASGVAGEICWDANYVYVCVATNTWKRSAISTW